MDLIERQAALECFHTWIDRNGDVCTPDDMPEYRAIEALPSAESDKRLEKIAELVDGTIDHFDREDAMDLLYQIKEVLNER